MKTNRFFKIWTIFILIFMYFPFAVIVYSSFSNSMNITIPLVEPGLSAYKAIFVEGKYVKSTILSLEIAVFTTIFSLILGTMASLAITRYMHLRIVKIINQMLLSTLMIPSVIIGVSLLVVWSNLGMAFNIAMVVIVHTVMVSPLVIRTITATLSNFDYTLEDSALVLGAKPMRTLFEISLPCIRAGLVTSAIFAFIGSFGDVVVTSFILPIGVKTLPIEIMNTLAFSLSTDLSAISTIVTFFIFIALYISFKLFPNAFAQQ